MTVIEVKENGAIRTKMLSCDSPFLCLWRGERYEVICVACLQVMRREESAAEIYIHTCRFRVYRMCARRG